MKVILQKNVPNLGDAGDVKEVADGYARNYLLPRKLVILAKAGSTKANEHHRRVIALKQDKRVKEMTELAGKLKDAASLQIAVRVGAKNKLYGSVTAMDLSNALKEKGFAIEKRKIEIPDPIRTLGNHKARVRLAEKVIVNLAVSVISDGTHVEEEPIPEPVAAVEEAPKEAAAEEKAAE
ncbi:MAG: 50S ribosomal protein L9 [Spirochaetia bacterium]|nr:50S ribosomal protein L9 [Spirochaetia bacterium]